MCIRFRDSLASRKIFSSRNLQLSAHTHLRHMSTFTLPGPVTVRSIPEISEDQLCSFPAFQTWLKTLRHSLALQAHEFHSFHTAPYELRSITIQSCDHFGGKRLGFLKLKAEVTNANGEYLPGSVFLRGGSVCMLLILQPDDVNENNEEYAVLTVQPRIAAGSLGFVELPAGMLDDNGTFSGGAAREIKEETGLEIPEGELLNMTSLAINEGSHGEEQVQQAMYPSPGACDEFIPLFLARKKMARATIEAMKGKLTGLREHGEKITLKICRLDELWRIGARDGKTLAAVAIYEGLKRERRI
jgi:ADP-sugar diphosphatase